MARKKKSADATAPETESTATEITTETVASSDKPKRGRPKGSAKDSTPKKGKRGRPKGSKNKKSTPVATKRGRGRPKGSGKAFKAAGVSPTNLRGIITKIVRDEVHSALLQAFKDM